jgi:hypothetical protein
MLTDILLLTVGYIIAILGVIRKTEKRKNESGQTETARLDAVGWIVAALLTVGLLFGLYKSKTAWQDKSLAKEVAKQTAQRLEQSNKETADLRKQTAYVGGLLSAQMQRATKEESKKILEELYADALATARANAGPGGRWGDMWGSFVFVGARERVPEGSLTTLKATDPSLSEQKTGWVFIGENPANQLQPVNNVQREKSDDRLDMREVGVGSRLKAMDKAKDKANIFLHVKQPVDDDKPAQANGIVFAGHTFEVLEKPPGIPSTHSPTLSFWVKVRTLPVTLRP